MAPLVEPLALVAARSASAVCVLQRLGQRGGSRRLSERIGRAAATAAVVGEPQWTRCRSGNLSLVVAVGTEMVRGSSLPSPETARTYVAEAGAVAVAVGKSPLPFLETFSCV